MRNPLAGRIARLGRRLKGRGFGANRQSGAGVPSKAMLSLRKEAEVAAKTRGRLQVDAGVGSVVEAAA